MRERAGSVAVAVALLATTLLACAGSGASDGRAALPSAGPAPEPRAAGCALRKHPVEGREHTARTVRYRTNPPTSGDHDPTASEDGVYASRYPPDVEQSVHALEHGRITFQYRPGTSSRRVAQLERLVAEPVKGARGYHTLLFRNQTQMPYAVAATAWRRSLTCRRMNDEVLAALREFRRAYVDKGPEFIP